MATVNTTTSAGNAPTIETAWLIDALNGPVCLAARAPGARPVHVLYTDDAADGVVLPDGFVARLLASDPTAIVCESGLVFLDLGEREDMVALAPAQLARMVADLCAALEHSSENSAELSLLDFA